LSWQQERITRVHILGTALVALGAGLTACFGSVNDEQLGVHALERQLLRPASIAYLGTELACIIAVGLSLRSRRIQSELRGIALGCVAGVLMGNVFFMKGFLGILHTAFDTGSLVAFLRPTPYIVMGAAVGGAVLGHVVMRKGLAEYKGVFMVTIFEGAHITAACLSGCVVMSELEGAPWWRFICYWCAVGVIVSGILLVNRAAGASRSIETDSFSTSTLTPRLSFSRPPGRGGSWHPSDNGIATPLPLPRLGEQLPNGTGSSGCVVAPVACAVQAPAGTTGSGQDINGAHLR